MKKKRAGVAAPAVRDTKNTIHKNMVSRQSGKGKEYGRKSRVLSLIRILKIGDCHGETKEVSDQKYHRDRGVP